MIRPQALRRSRRLRDQGFAGARVQTSETQAITPDKGIGELSAILSGRAREAEEALAGSRCSLEADGIR